MFLLGPSVLSACDNLTLDATSSKGSGGRPWASVVWTVSPKSATVDVTDLMNFLSSITTGISNVVIVNAALFPPNDPDPANNIFDFQVTVTNFLGESGIGFLSTSKSSNPNIPNVMIVGESIFEVNPKDEKIP